MLLHIGAPKTGTTFLQELMWHHRHALAAHGVHYPGRHPELHFEAAIDLQGVDFNDWHNPAAEGAWGRLVDELRGLRGTAVVSHELYGDASEEVVDRALADLAFADVEIVLTLRDLARQLPAAWQEDLKNRHYMSFEEFAAAARPDNDVGAWYGDEFWRRQDVHRVLLRWTRNLPTDKVHLVTLPRRGAGQEELWRRFASVVRVDPALADPAHPEIRRNRSLGQREAQVLRRLNVLVEDRVEWPVYGEVMAHLGEHVLGQGGDPILLPAEHRGWVAKAAQEMVDALRGSGHPVVGDLDELLVDTVAPQDGRHPDAGDDAEVLATAIELLATVLYLKPVPREPPPLPRAVALADRVVWRAYVTARHARDVVRSRAARDRRG